MDNSARPCTSSGKAPFVLPQSVVIGSDLTTSNRYMARLAASIVDAEDDKPKKKLTRLFVLSGFRSNKGIVSERFINKSYLSTNDTEALINSTNLLGQIIEVFVTPKIIADYLGNHSLSAYHRCSYAALVCAVATKMSETGKFVVNFSLKDLADEMGVPLPTANLILRRAAKNAIVMRKGKRGSFYGGNVCLNPDFVEFILRDLNLSYNIDRKLAIFQLDVQHANEVDCAERMRIFEFYCFETAFQMLRFLMFRKELSRYGIDLCISDFKFFIAKRFDSERFLLSVIASARAGKLNKVVAISLDGFEIVLDGGEIIEMELDRPTNERSVFLKQSIRKLLPPFIFRRKFGLGPMGQFILDSMPWDHESCVGIPTRKIVDTIGGISLKELNRYLRRARSGIANGSLCGSKVVIENLGRLKLDIIKLLNKSNSGEFFREAADLYLKFSKKYNFSSMNLLAYRCLPHWRKNKQDGNMINLDNLPPESRKKLKDLVSGKIKQIMNAVRERRIIKKKMLQAAVLGINTFVVSYWAENLVKVTVCSDRISEYFEFFKPLLI